MSKTLNSLIGLFSEFVARVNRYIATQNERQVALWGSSLQYKRRYTNPDAAKRFRSAP